MGGNHSRLSGPRGQRRSSQLDDLNLNLDQPPQDCRTGDRNERGEVGSTVQMKLEGMQIRLIEGLGVGTSIVGDHHGRRVVWQATMLEWESESRGNLFTLEGESI